MRSKDCKEFLLAQAKDNTHFNNTVKEFDDDLKRLSYYKKVEHNTHVNVNNIIGTTHSSYQNISWLMLFEKGLNRYSALEYISNSPDILCDTKYYTQGAEYRSKFYQSKSWGVYIINGNDAYIIEGNHRSTLAKFLANAKLIPNQIIFPYVCHLKCDIDALNAYRKIKEKVTLLDKEENHILFISLDAKHILLSKDNQEETYSLEYTFYMRKNSIDTHIKKVTDNINIMIEYIELSIVVEKKKNYWDYLKELLFHPHKKPPNNLNYFLF